MRQMSLYYYVPFLSQKYFDIKYIINNIVSRWYVFLGTCLNSL